MFGKKSEAKRESKRPPNHIVAHANTIASKWLGAELKRRYFNRVSELPDGYLYNWSIVAHDDSGHPDAEATARIIFTHARMSDQEWADYSLFWRDPEAHGDLIISNKLRQAGIDPNSLPDATSRAQKVFEIAMNKLKEDKTTEE